MKVRMTVSTPYGVLIGPTDELPDPDDYNEMVEMFKKIMSKSVSIIVHLESGDSVVLCKTVLENSMFTFEKVN